MANIDFRTKLIPLLGKPKESPLALRLVNCGLEAANLNARCLYSAVETEHLADVVGGVRHLNCAGLALTIPHQKEVLSLLDELDPLCAKMACCDTAVKQEGKLIGHNALGTGFYTAITRDGEDTKDRTVFCLGSGCEGHAICGILAYYGVKKLYITDPLDSCAQALATAINEGIAPVAEYVPFQNFDHLSECSMVIHTSHSGELALPAELMRKEAYYFDTCPFPAKSQFLQSAEAAGAKFLDGSGMSLYTAMEQIRLWTGEEAPEEAMQLELARILEEKSTKA